MAIALFIKIGIGWSSSSSSPLEQLSFHPQWSFTLRTQAPNSNQAESEGTLEAISSIVGGAAQMKRSFPQNEYKVELVLIVA